VLRRCKRLMHLRYPFSGRFPRCGLQSGRSAFHQIRSFRFRPLLDVRSSRTVNRKRSFAGLVSLFSIVVGMYIRLSIDVSHPQRSIQLPLLNVARYDHPELTETYVGSRCWLNRLFSRVAALAIGIKYYAVKSRLVFYAGQRSVIAVVNYLDGLPGARLDRDRRPSRDRVLSCRCLTMRDDRAPSCRRACSWAD